MRRVSIVRADLEIGRVAVDHGIHVARSNAEVEVRLAQCGEVVRIVPVWLSDDPHPEALRFQHAPHNSHTKARVVDVGITGYQNDVTGVPSQLIHLGTRHG